MTSKSTNTLSARDLYQAKQKAMEYYSQNGVPQKMETILNSMFLDNPDDVYGHLANFFEKFAKVPTISKIQARQAYDSKGEPTIQTEIYCTVKNKERLISTSVSSTQNSYIPENARVEDKEPDEKERYESVKTAIKVINADLNNRLQGMDPTQQSQADNIIIKLYEELKAADEERQAREAAEKAAADGDESSPSKDETASVTSGGGKKGKGSAKKGKSVAAVVIPEEPREKMLNGANAVCTLSQAISLAASYIQDLNLYEHISSLKYGSVKNEFQIPLPMVTILQSGRPAPGKLNCVKEFMVVPKPGMPVEQSLQYIHQIYKYVANSFFTKSGVTAKLVNDLGALCPTFDRPEQGLDLLQEAITHLGLSPGDDFHIALNCASNEIFDYEKGKYEIISGQPKVPEDVTEFWAELLSRYPSVIALIDPLRQQDREHWMRLCEGISDNSYVIGGHAYSRPGILKDEELTEDFKSSGIVLKMEQLNTLTDILQCTKKMEEAGNVIVVAACNGESGSTFLADLAVGLNAKFVKFGAPVRGERIALYNRLIQIEEQLKQQGKLVVHKEHLFPHISPPPLPEPEDGAEVVEDSLPVKNVPKKK